MSPRQRLRWWLARLLVGDFVTLPPRQKAAVWIIVRSDGATLTIPVGTMSLELANALTPLPPEAKTYTFTPSTTTGTFSGTIGE